MFLFVLALCKILAVAIIVNVFWREGVSCCMQTKGEILYLQMVTILG